MDKENGKRQPLNVNLNREINQKRVVETAPDLRLVNPMRKVFIMSFPTSENSTPVNFYQTISTFLQMKK